MDPAQIVFLLIAVVLTILLVVLGVQVFLILREVRMVVARANKLLDNIEEVTVSVKDSLERLTSLTGGIKIGSFLLSLFRNFSRKRQEARE